MFGSNVIDILIGLIVIFLSVGLAVSAGTELMSYWLALRPQQLKKALIGMLDGGSAAGTEIPDDHWFFNQTLLRSMADWGKKFPSYLDSKTFSQALLLAIDKDFAGKKADELATSLEQSLDRLKINAGVKDLIRNYIRQSKGDVVKFQELVGAWFDQVMDRATGWYKRNVGMIGLWLAVGIVCLANIDTLAIARALHGSDTLRVKMLEVASKLAPAESNPVPARAPPAAGAQAPAPSGAPAADAAAQASAPAAAVSAGASAGSPTASAPANANAPAAPAEPAAPTKQDADNARRQIEGLKKEFDTMQQAGLPLGWKGNWPNGWDWLTKIMGLLITISAATLGAPFWFDMLTKIINIRYAGPKPVTKTEVVSPPVEKGEH